MKSGQIRAALFVSCVLLLRGTYAEFLTITVNTPIPLDWVARELGCRYGVGISYEGPIFEHPDDLVDIERLSAPAPEAITNCSDSSEIVSRHCYFSARYAVDPGTGQPTNIVTMLREIVGDYNRADNPGKFTVIETLAGPSIVATAVKGRTGEWKKAEMLLDRPISVSVTNVTNMQALGAVLRSLQALTGAKLFPNSLKQPRGSITLHAENEPARDVLARLLVHPEYGGCSNRWQLFYAPCPPAYGFEETSSIKGFDIGSAPEYPWHLIGNVTHPDYRGESAQKK